MLCFSCIYASSLAGWRMCLKHVCKKYHIRLHVQYSLPDDEHKMFETCRKQEELK
jgi:hypothetical protein